jgi:hypothetical protein
VQDAAVAAPTLDEFMRRDPADVDTEGRARMVELLRHDRPIFIKAEADRKAKRKEKDDDGKR